MKAPESLETLLDYGIIQDVIRPLMSGKEAQVYVVVADGRECVAKVYKEAIQRTFRQRTEYTEGRRTRNSRDQRAIGKRTKHGRKQDEDAWRSTEVDMIYRLRAAGVRVPEPLNFVDGVLVMELVQGADGRPAPRLGDLEFAPDEAIEIHAKIMREVVRMLCAGVIHGDLSEFNVLLGVDGPVVIDFPQSVDPAQNQSSRKLLLRDVDNVQRFLARHAPEQRIAPLGQELWALFEKNQLRPDTVLTGHYAAPEGKADTTEVMALIDDAEREQRMRRGDRDDEEDDDELDAPPRPAFARRIVVDIASETKPKAHPRKGKPGANARNKEPRANARNKEPRANARNKEPNGRPGSRPAARDRAGAAHPPRSDRGSRPTAADADPRAAGSRAPDGPPNDARDGAGGRAPSRRRGRRRRSGGGTETSGSATGGAPRAQTQAPRPADADGASGRPRKRRRRSRGRSEGDGATSGPPRPSEDTPATPSKGRNPDAPARKPDAPRPARRRRRRPPAKGPAR